MPVSTLRAAHLRDWLKRYRKAILPARVRYYAVGEYGNETQRPHYHLALFGVPGCKNVITKMDRDFCCSVCQVFKDTWSVDGEPLGAIQVGTLESSSAAYIAGYVTKKFMAAPLILDGREPEFQRMSLKPAIGCDAMWDVASAVMSYDLGKVDVPRALRHGSALMPLGRTLRRKLRVMCGVDPGAPKAILDAMAAEVLPLRVSAYVNSRSFKEEVIAASRGAIANLAAKEVIWKLRRKI